MKAKSEFSVSKWEETNCGEPANNMLVSRASIIYEVSGTISGKFDVEYLLHYVNYDPAEQHNATATYIGYLTFSGSIDGMSGSFVFEDKGFYSPAGPVSELKIKPDTGSNDFKGISGIGRYYADDGKMMMEIDYSF